MSPSSQSLRFILSLRRYSSFITSMPVFPPHNGIFNIEFRIAVKLHLGDVVLVQFLATFYHKILVFIFTLTRN